MIYSVRSMLKRDSASRFPRTAPCLMRLRDELRAVWRSFRTATIFCLILCALAATAGLLGQDARGRITGRVSDQSGAPVPRATIEAVQDASGLKFTATSNGAGSYELLYLAPGTYSLAVSVQGFETVKQTGL